MSEIHATSKIFVLTLKLSTLNNALPRRYWTSKYSAPVKSSLLATESIPGSYWIHHSSRDVPA